jgi:hypothetical protein
MDSDFLELVLLAEGITVSLRSHFVLEHVKNSLSCLGSHPNFSGNPPTVSSVSNIRDIKFSLNFCLSASKNPIRKFNSSIEQPTKSQRPIMILQDMYSDKQHFTAQGTPYSVAT